MKLIELTPQEILDIFRNQYLSDTGQQMTVGSEEEILSNIMTLALSTATNRLNAGYMNTQLSTAQGTALDAIGEMYGVTRETAETPRRIDVSLSSKSGHTITPSDVITLAGVDFHPLEAFTFPLRSTTGSPIVLETISPLAQPTPVEDLREAVAALVADDTPWFKAALQSPMYPDGGEFPYTEEGDDRFREYIKARRFAKIAGIRSTINDALLDSHPQIKSVYTLNQFDEGFVDGHVTSYIRVVPFASTLPYSGDQIALKSAKAALNDEVTTLAQIVDPVKLAGQTLITARVIGVYSAALSSSLIETYCETVRNWLNSRWQIGDTVTGAEVIKALTTPLAELGTADELGINAATFDKLRTYRLLEASLGGKVFTTVSPTKYPQIEFTLELTRV